MSGPRRTRAALSRCLAGTVVAAAVAATLPPQAGLAAVPAPLPGLPGAIGALHRPVTVARARLRRPPLIAAPAAEIVNVTTGRELWGREQDIERPIASITKVMTALVVIKSGNLGRRIRITQADENYLGCCIQGAGLIPGDVLTARQLLNAMLLPSGADAALALASSFGPGVAAFVRKMNQTAQALHLTRTHFTSFDGVLPSNVSTPSDLVKLGEAAMQQAAFAAVVGRRYYQLGANGSHHYYFWRNRNQLIGSYPGATGIKTGWIPQSGECLLFAATRGTRDLVGVVLDSAGSDQSSQSFYDAETLLNWGFEPGT